MPESCAAAFIPVIRQGTTGSLLKVIPIKGITFDWNTQICQAEVPTGELRPLGRYLRFLRYFSLQSLHKSFFSFILNVYFFPNYWDSHEVKESFKMVVKPKWSLKKNNNNRFAKVSEWTEMKQTKKRSIRPLENPAMYPSMLCRPYSFHPVLVPKETGGLVPFCRNCKQQQM